MLLAVALLAALAGLLAAAAIAPRAYAWAQPRLVYYRWDPDAVASAHAPTLVRNVSRVFTHWLKGTLDAPELDALYLDIRWKHVDQLRRMRAEALAQGQLTEAQRAFVPATIRQGERVLRVKLRLKGDLTDHLKGKTWSYRVHVRDGGQILGMRRFSIQHPSTRAYETEPLYFQHLRRFDVLAPRHVFARVSVNGDALGVMALEEHFAKELVESQRRRGGVVVAFDEADFWTNYLEHGDHGAYDNFRIHPIRVFRESWVARDPALARDARIAQGLLRRFVAGELSASRVFDVGVLARYLAVSELWGAYHAIRWHNQRFYYNPLTTRLEPIGFDRGMRVRDFGAAPVSELEPIVMQMLADPEVEAAFFRAVAEVAADYDAAAADELRERAAAHLRSLHVDTPYLMPLPLAELGRRARAMAGWQQLEDRAPTKLPPAQDDYPHPVVAEYHERAGQLHVVLRNRTPVPVEVIRLDAGDEAARSPAIPAGLVLPGTPAFGSPTPMTFAVSAPPAEARPSLRLKVRVAGRARTQAVPLGELHPDVAPPLRLPTSDALPAILARHPYLHHDVAEGRVGVRPGEWQVAGSLAIPRGLGLRIPAGTTLRFAAGQGIFAAGPLAFEGTADAPVVLAAADPAAGWAGLALLTSPEPSRLEHVVVRGTRGFTADFAPTGAVTLHAAEAELRGCRFEGSQAEDALNLVRGRFRLVDVSFADTRSDALDADFAELAIVGGEYRAVGGDAVDVSGTEASLEGIRFRDVRDKAVSVGEGSTLVASELDVARVGTGVVSKDRSRTRVLSSRFAEVEHVALMAYVKKPEYGPAELEAEDVVLVGEGSLAVVQAGSRLTVDGREIAGETLDVDRLYASSMKK